MTVVRLDTFKISDVSLSVAIVRRTVSMTLHDRATLQNAVVWSREIKAKRYDASEVLRHYTRLADAMLTLIKASSKDNVKAILRGEAMPLTKRYMTHLIQLDKEERNRRNSGVIYDNEGWRVHHPIASVWIITTPQNFGTVTAVALRGRQRIQLTIEPHEKLAKTLRYDSVHGALRAGVTMIYRDHGVLLDVNKLDLILVECGIVQGSGSIMTKATHERLQKIIQTLTDAANKGGIYAIETRLVELANEHGRV